MKRALTLAAGLSIGYVAGTRAGREKYEQMKHKVHEVSQQPAVAGMRENLQEQVGTATKAVAEKVTDAASEFSKKLHITSDHEASDHGAADHGAAADHQQQNPAKPTPGGAMG